MECYTSSVAGLKRGIDVRGQPLGIELGEKGRRRKFVRIPLDQDPPKIFVGDRHGIRIWWVTDIAELDPENLSLARPQKHNPTAMIVRVRTAATPSIGSKGVWRALEGASELLVEGLGGHGAFCDKSSWKDDLVLMRVGDVIRVDPENAPPYTLTCIGPRQLDQNLLLGTT